MKKLFRHVAGVIVFSFVACFLFPLFVYGSIIDSMEICRSSVYNYGGYTKYYKYSAIDFNGDYQLCILSHPSDTNPDFRYYYVVCSNTTIGIDVKREQFHADSSGNFPSEPFDSSITRHDGFYVDNDKGQRCYCTPVTNVTPSDYDTGYAPLSFNVSVLDFASSDAMYDFVKKGDISEDIPVDTDGYSLDKSVGMVKNAHWRHLESKDEYNKVLQDAINSGTGTGDPGNANYSDIYTHYASFVQDKCSFATTSTTGVKIGGRYQLQYASRVGFTFAYNLPDLLESIDNTKQYYKKFGSPKPYPVVDGTNFDANQNIQSLFVQAYQWNDTLPSIGTWKRALVFKETKYWIDVRIIDTKNKTYGAWYAMDMETNKASEVTTDNGDIDGDITSDDPADPYAKIEGEGDTFKDAEDNSHEVDHTQTYDQTWYDHIKDNTKKSAPAFKNLLSMITGIPKMIATLFSWLPNWVLELVSAFFAIVIVLALLRFVLGS